MKKKFTLLAFLLCKIALSQINITNDSNYEISKLTILNSSNRCINSNGVLELENELKSTFSIGKKILLAQSSFNGTDKKLMLISKIMIP